MAVRSRLAGSGAASASHVVTLPPDVEVGDRLFVGVSYDGGNVVSASADGWQSLGSQPQGTNLALAVFTRVATGSDDCTVTLSATEQAAWVAICQAGDGGAPGAAAFNDGANATSGDVAAVTGLASGDYDSLIFLGVDNNGDPGHTITEWPTDWENLTSPGDNTDAVCVYSMDRSATGVTGFTPTPGFTWTNADQWVTAHVASPAAAVPGQVRLPADPGEALWIGRDGGNWYNVGLGQPGGGTNHNDYSWQQIRDGYSDPDRFYLNADGNVEFRVKVDAGTTSPNTDYPRSELREFDINGGSDGEAAWSTDGLNYMQATSRVNEVTTVKPEVCFFQIHDTRSDLIRVITTDGGGGAEGLRLEALWTPPGSENEDSQIILSAYDLGQWLDWRIEVEDGTVRIDLDGTEVLSVSNMDTTGCYFKHGAYAQSNTSTEDGDAEQWFIVETEKGSFQTWHTGYPPPSEPVYTGPLTGEVHRFYLTSEGAPYAPGNARSFWTDTSAGLNSPHLLSKTPAGAPDSTSQSETSATDLTYVLLGQWVSDPATADGTLLGIYETVQGRRESDSAAFMWHATAVWVTAGSTSTSRGIAWTDANSPLFPTTATAQLSERNDGAEVDFLAGDRIVVEIGYQADNTDTAPYTGEVYYGGTGSPDLAPGDTDFTLPSWYDLQVTPGVTFEDVAQVIAPPSIGAPIVSQEPTVRLGGIVAPDTIPPPDLPAPVVHPGPVSIQVGSAIPAPTPPVPEPSVVQIIRPVFIPSGSVVYGPTIEAGIRPPLRIDFWAVDDDGALLCPLPEPLSWDMSIIPGEKGTITLEYPRDGLHFDVLDERVTRSRDLRIRIRTDRIAVTALSGILDARDGEEVAESGSVSFYGAFLPALLDEAPLPYNTADERGEWTFIDGTAGSILRDVLATVQADNYLTSLTWTFTDTHDSTGLPWQHQTTARVSPGRSVLQVAQQLRAWGMLEFEVVDTAGGDLQLRAFDPSSVGTDFTLWDPPIVFRAGRDLLESPHRTDVSKAVTSLLVAGDDGIYVEVDDPTAVAERGRKIGRYVSEGNLTTAGAAQAYGLIELARTTHGVDEITHALTFDQNQPAPVRELLPLDYIYSDRGSGLTRLRIAQVTVSQRAGRDHYSGAVVLGDLIDSRDVHLQRQLDGLVGGQVITGTSQPAPPSDDGKPPAQVQGVGVASGAYQEQGRTAAAVTATWLQVEDNADGSPADDIDYYSIQWRYIGGNPNLPTEWTSVASVTDTDATWDGVSPGEAVEVRVRAVDRWGHVGAWSDPELHTTDSDTTPPPVPSTPVAASYLGILTIEWDGLGSAGEAMPADFSYVEVHVSDTPGFTPGPATYVDRLFGVGTMPWTGGVYGTTYYAKLVSVDSSGNASAASAQDSATLQQAADGDIGSLSIGKLSAGVLDVLMTVSGIIRTADTGSRVELDSNGLRCYNAAGEVVFSYDIPTGDMEMVGRLVAGAGIGQGRTIEIEPNGTDPEINLYTDASAQRVRMRALEDVAPNGVNSPLFQASSVDATGNETGPSLELWDSGGQIVTHFSGSGGGIVYAGNNNQSSGAQTKGAFIGWIPPTDGNGIATSYVWVQDTGDILLARDSSGAQLRIDDFGINASVPFGDSGNGLSFTAQNGNSDGYRAYVSGGVLKFVNNSTNEIIELGGDAVGRYAYQGEKSFVIPHPLDGDRWLVHGCTESPWAGVEYWGEAEIVDGRAVVPLPHYFEVLTQEHNRNVQVTAVGELCMVAADPITDGQFTIRCSGPDGTRVNWLVKAARHATFEVEPHHDDVVVSGFGPYRTTTPRNRTIP